jgi:hypothetical protein
MSSQQLLPAGTANRFAGPPPFPPAGPDAAPGLQRSELQHGSLDQTAAL